MTDDAKDGLIDDPNEERWPRRPVPRKPNERRVRRKPSLRAESLHNSIESLEHGVSDPD